LIDGASPAASGDPRRQVEGLPSFGAHRITALAPRFHRDDRSPRFAPRLRVADFCLPDHGPAGRGWTGGISRRVLTSLNLESAHARSTLAPLSNAPFSSTGS
jgi:hypothetical protein